MADITITVDKVVLLKRLQENRAWPRLVANIRSLDGDLKKMAIRDFYRWAESISR